MAIPLTDFAGQNWLITPAALAFGEPPPESIHDQSWILVLSGVVMANLEGNSNSEWLHETVSFLPDMAGSGGSGPLNWAINRWNIPTPADGTFTVGFSLEEWAPFVSLSSIFDRSESINAGFAVDAWRPTPFGAGYDAFSSQPIGDLFMGVTADVAIQDNDAWLYRLGYNITLRGRIVFLTVPVILFRSDFDRTPVGEPPQPVQPVGTVRVEGPPGDVVVATDPPLPFPRWARISRLTVGSNASLVCLLKGGATGFGVFSIAAELLMHPDSGIASIAFETESADQFLHIDFMPNNTVRIDDIDGTEFGSFVRGQPLQVKVVLNIEGTSPTARISLFGAASGETLYTVQNAFRTLTAGFAAVRVFQGVPNVGAFDATSVVVAREV